MGGATISLLGATTRLNPYCLYPLVFTVICLPIGLVSEALAVIIFWSIAYSLGLVVERMLRASPAFLGGSNLTRLASGYVILALILTLLAYTPFNTMPVFALLFCLPCVYAAANFLRQAKSVDIWSEIFVDVPRFEWLQTFSLSVILTLLFICALQPDIGSDSINAYRSKLLELRNFGRFTWDPEKTAVGLVPNSALWGQSFVVIVSGNYEAAKLVNFSKLLLTVFIIKKILTQMNLNTRSANWSGFLGCGLSAALLSTPIFVYTSAQGFYDNAVYLLTFVFIYFVLLHKHKGGDNWVYTSVLIGLTSGLILLTKLTSIFVVPAFALFYLGATFQAGSRKQVFQGWIAAAVLASLVFGAHLLFVYSQTGNPVFPFYNSVFNSPHFGENDLKGPHNGYISWRLFWDMTFNTASFSEAGSRDGQLGLIGVLFLSGLFLWIGSRSRIKWASNVLILLSLFSFALAAVLVAVFQNSARYMMVALPFLMVGLGLLSIGYRQNETGLFLAVFTACNLYLLPSYGYGRIALTGAIPSYHKNIILQSRPVRLAADRLADEYGGTGRVLFFGSNGGYSGRVFENGWYDYATGRALAMLDCNDVSAAHNFLKERQLDAVVINSKGRQYLDKFKPECLTFFEETADTETYIGSTLVYTMPDEISHDLKIEFSGEPVAHNQNLLNTSGLSSVVIRIDVGCQGAVNFRLLSKGADGSWERVIFLPLNCRDGSDSLSLRFDELDPASVTVLTANYGKEAEISEAFGTVSAR